MAILRDFVFLHYIAVKYQNRHGHGAGTGTGIGAVVGSGLGHWQMQSALENLKVSLVQAGRQAVLSCCHCQTSPSPLLLPSLLLFWTFLASFYVLRLIKLN